MDIIRKFIKFCIKYIRFSYIALFVLFTVATLPFITIGWLVFGQDFFNACNEAYTLIAKTMENSFKL